MDFPAKNNFQFRSQVVNLTPLTSTAVSLDLHRFRQIAFGLDSA